MGKKLLIGLVIFLALFFRIYQIYTNGHFHADEARDLVNIHQIWVEKKITLVGPISDDGGHLFSSLTYYLLLPFAIMFDFTPMGTVSGAVFWGIVTFGIFWLLAVRTNPKMLVLSGILASVWWPLIETSRWPWNPNFVPLWVALSIYLSLNKNKLINFLSGLFGGFGLHHHFLSVSSLFFVWLKTKKITWIIGFFLAILPFLIFDWRHPPGLFLPKIISQSHQNSLPKLAEIIPKIIDSIKFTGNYLFPGNFLTLIIGLLVLAIFIWDIKNKTKNIFWGISSLLSLWILLFYSHQHQYILGILPLFWMWLFGQRDKLGQKMVVMLVSLICLSSLSRYRLYINTDSFKDNPKVVTEACRIISQQIKQQGLKNPNIAVLGTPDQDRIGTTYRNVLLAWNVRIKGPRELLLSDNLFVISQKEVNNLKGDGASEIDGFRQGVVKGDWKIKDTSWRVVQFNRY